MYEHPGARPWNCDVQQKHVTKGYLGKFYRPHEKTNSLYFKYTFSMLFYLIFYAKLNAIVFVLLGCIVVEI